MYNAFAKAKPAKISDCIKYMVLCIAYYYLLDIYLHKKIIGYGINKPK